MDGGSSAGVEVEEGVPECTGGGGEEEEAGRQVGSLMRTRSPRAALALAQADAEARKKDEVRQETAAESEVEAQLQRDIDDIAREIETATPGAKLQLGTAPALAPALSPSQHGAEPEPEPAGVAQACIEELQDAVKIEEDLHGRIAALAEQQATAKSELEVAERRTGELRELLQQQLAAQVFLQHQADAEAVAAAELEDQDQDQAEAKAEAEAEEAEEEEEEEDSETKSAEEDSGSDATESVDSDDSDDSDDSESDDEDEDDAARGPPAAETFMVAVNSEDPSAPAIRVRLDVSTAGLRASKAKASTSRPGTRVQSGDFEEVFLYGWPQVRNWTPHLDKHQSGIKFTITNVGVYEFRTSKSEEIIAAIMQQINHLLAMQKQASDPAAERAQQAREERARVAKQLMSVGVSQRNALEALDANQCDFRTAAQALDLQLDVPQFVRSPIGLPNRSNDCFWLATVQCLRHVPGFSQTVTASMDTALQRPPQNVAHALANLLLRMERQRETDYLRRQCPELNDFIRMCERNLPKDDGHSLVQSNFRRQEQEDSNEYLNQLLNVLGAYAFEGGEDTGNAGPPLSRKASTLEEIHRMRQRLLAIEQELTEASKSEDWGRVYELVSEFAEIQWDSSQLRLRSGVGELFEGQRLVVMECSACHRWSAGSADSFLMEEVRVQPTRIGTRRGKADNSLTAMLRANTSRNSPEGYRCDGCGAADTTAFRDCLRKLPQVYAVHVNRTRPDGSRCAESVAFEETLDLKNMLLYQNKGALDHSNRPCATTYQLAAVTFHCGVSARSGHYVACVKDLSLGQTPQYIVAKRLKVTAEVSPSSAEVMYLEPGTSVVCLEQREHASFGLLSRATPRLLCQFGWVTCGAGALSRASGWTELNDDDVTECGPGETPQAFEHSRAGSRAAMLFYVRDGVAADDGDDDDGELTTAAED